MSLDKHIAVGRLNDYYGALLTDYQKEMIGLYFDCDLSLAEIGEQYGVTRQAVRNVLVRSEDKLREFEDKLGLVGKISELNGKLQEVVRLETAEEMKAALAAIINEVKEL